MAYTCQGQTILQRKAQDVDKEAVDEVEEVVAEAAEETSTILLHHHHLNPLNQPTSFAGPAGRKDIGQQAAHLKL